MTTVHEGSVHGRFQPFHLGHLAYVVEAARLCEFLWVGITQPEIGGLTGEDTNIDHRYRERDNPLTYWERVTVVEAALRNAGLEDSAFRIVPFPIERPEVLPEYIPTQVVAYTTIREEWNRQKIEILRNLGYRVSVLWEDDDRQFSGGEVRGLLRAGDQRWRTLVAPGVPEVLDRLGIPGRLLDAALG